MAKTNPNRQELLDFINSITSQLGIQAKKIEDLASGIHYLQLLHQVHPDVVKMAKVNLKACQQYENINNLRLLAAHLAQVKAPFTFQVQKVSQRNYQENLNLLKNLYKHYYTHQKTDKPLNVSVDSRISSNASIEKKKSKPKLIVKPLAKLISTSQPQKYDVQNSGFEGIINESKVRAEQIRKIMIIVKEQQKSHQEVTAQEKLNKIKKILGLQSPYSHSKKKNKPSQFQNLNFSTKNQASKSSSKKNLEIQSDIQIKKEIQQLDKIDPKSESIKQPQNPEHPGDSKKAQKQFDCEQIKQNALKKYEIRPVSTRKSRNARFSKDNVHLWANQEQDTQYNENLLSPGPQVLQHTFKQKSVRKTILRKSQHNFNQPIQRNESLKKVHFPGEKMPTHKKEMISASKEIETLSRKKQEKMSPMNEDFKISERKQVMNSVDKKQNTSALSNKQQTH